jgi:CRISPR-associated endonuclease/helicase Cas3
MHTNGLAPSDFGSFFKALWGFDAFPWQARLLLRLATGEDTPPRDKGELGLWPDVLDLPTGSGKTAALDIALFHLALEAPKGGERKAPIRIAFVVDRRLIVDDAFQRAQQIQNALLWSLLEESEAKSLEAKEPGLSELIRRVRAEPVVKEVALRLRHLAGSGEPPLIVRRLRGGTPLEDDWARTPVQPTILCSTVDQVGSRLLFRGYGVSNSMKPIHAGLLGSDCLILLDEAHLAEPFRQTLNSVERLRGGDKAPLGIALLTATPSTHAERPFGLTSEDHSHPILSRRIAVSKPTRLTEISGKQGVDTETRRVDAVFEASKLVISNLKSSGIGQPAVGVVVNRVARARAVFDRLRKELEDTEVVLLIGPGRSIERDRIANQLDSIRTGHDKARSNLQAPFVIVATQTIEAGVDIDFDGLVTEAASLDALRQRFGRLNRGGRQMTTEAVLLAHKDDIGPKADDPVYGDRIAKTWEVMNRWQSSASDGRIDFGINAMTSALSDEEVSQLVAEPKPAPVLLPAYANLWSQTSPIPNADPEVALFLHGPATAPAGVQVVWRADIDDPRQGDGYRERIIELLKLVPPRVSEAIEVPIWSVREWLNQIRPSDFSDTIEREPEAEERNQTARPAFRWAGPNDESSKVVLPTGIRPGDMVVVPANYGGCDEWGWTGSLDPPVFDVAAAALWPYRTRRSAVRITPELIVQEIRREAAERQQRDIANAPEIVDLEGIRNALKTKLAENASSRTSELLDAIREIELPRQIRDQLNVLKQHKGWLSHEFPYGFDEEERPLGIVFVAQRDLKDRELKDSVAIPATESDDLGSVSDFPIPLIVHCKDVRDCAQAFVTRAGLRANEAADVILAAFLHDAGKADPRFQSFFMGGDPYGPDLENVLAKSGQRRLPRGAWARAGLPSDWRHEALSVRLAIIHRDFRHAHDPKLVLWLIGTHHGFGRPSFPHSDVKDAEHRPALLKSYGLDSDVTPGAGPQSLAFDFQGLDWSQIFESLKQRYGIWGLARLESFIRLADHRASEGAPGIGEPLKEAAE